MKAILPLRLICSDLPSVAQTFGLQDKAQTLQPGDPQADGSLIFNCAVAVRPRQGDAPPDFSGPHVHGPKGDRFLYLSLRGDDGNWVRRIKIPLNLITWPQIGQVQGGQGHRLSATVSGLRAARADLPAGWMVDDA
jgi:hypothetical protein